MAKGNNSQKKEKRNPKKINPRSEIMPKIDIYPNTPKPDWMKKGAWCYCWGEANDKFIVEIIGENAAFLKTKSGYDHGWESFTKLHRG